MKITRRNRDKETKTTVLKQFDCMEDAVIYFEKLRTRCRAHRVYNLRSSSKNEFFAQCEGNTLIFKLVK